MVLHVVVTALCSQQVIAVGATNFTDRCFAMFSLTRVDSAVTTCQDRPERDFIIDHLLVQIHLNVQCRMMRVTLPESARTAP